MRPVLWASLTLVSAIVSSQLAGGKLKNLATDRSQETTSTALNASMPSNGRQAERLVALSANLYGHFLAHPSLDGQRIGMLVDTGATLVVLSYEDAKLAGIASGPNSARKKLSTANGVVEASQIRIREIRLGDILVQDVEAVIMPRGVLETSLLGMSFLRRLKGFEIAQGRLILKG